MPGANAPHRLDKEPDLVCPHFEAIVIPHGVAHSGVLPPPFRSGKRLLRREAHGEKFPAAGCRDQVKEQPSEYKNSDENECNEKQRMLLDPGLHLN